MTPMIRRHDCSRLTQFDALLIRETTAVPHHTFKFARKAASAGMPVIDDPGSIMRCTNKAYPAELLQGHGVATPRTRLLSRRTSKESEIVLVQDFMYPPFDWRVGVLDGQPLLVARPRRERFRRPPEPEDPADGAAHPGSAAGLGSRQPVAHAQRRHDVAGLGRLVFAWLGPQTSHNSWR